MATRSTTAVTALLDANKHPLRKAIKTLRSLILPAERSVEDGVRWKAESFPTNEWFATLNDPKQLKEAMNILHTGAKVKGLVLKDLVAEPHGLITWLGKDRGTIM